MSETTTMEKWQLEDLVADAVAIGNLRPEMLNEYVYQFKHHGKDVCDLTAASYYQIALENGLTTEKITREDMPDGVFYEVWVAKPEEGVDKELWIRKAGVAYEPFILGKRFDRFCFQKALTKATRNAIKQFVTASARHKAISRLQGFDIPPDEPVEVVVQPEREVSKIEESTLELWKTHKEHMESSGISSELFWAAVQTRYGVHGREDMTEEQWDDLYESLAHVEPDENATPYAKWIWDIVPF